MKRIGQWFFTIFVMLCIGSFVFRFFAWGHQSSDYEQIADRITANTGKQLKEQKHLYLIGTGGRMMNDIQMMAMSFHYYQEVDLQAARTLLVDAVTSYLVAINSSEEVRPYLHEYPFTATNVNIMIFVYNPDRSELPMDKIYFMQCLNGQLKYYTRSNTRKAFYEESYEEGVKQVHDVLENSL